jgi:hypothetical protein
MIVTIPTDSLYGTSKQAINPFSFPRGFNFGEFKDGKAQQSLPTTFIPHEADINRFTNLCRQTCDKILTLLALGLDVCHAPFLHPFAHP